MIAIVNFVTEVFRIRCACEGKGKKLEKIGRQNRLVETSPFPNQSDPTLQTLSSLRLE